jgi:hypothetical protein
MKTIKHLPSSLLKRFRLFIRILFMSKAAKERYYYREGMRKFEQLSKFYEESRNDFKKTAEKIKQALKEATQKGEQN